MSPLAACGTQLVSTLVWRGESLIMKSATDEKAIVSCQAREQFDAFLHSEDTIDFSLPRTPRLSILLVLYNRAELTLTCLRSLKPHLNEAAAEVIFVDNASRDETPLLLERLRGAKVIRNVENRGFAHAVNQAASKARGEHLLLLNNDTEVLGDSVATAVRFFSAHEDVGAVGGRILLLDGSLQEAGCAIWREGHVQQYGRGNDPQAPEYHFQRDVDYCSGTFLLTRRKLFCSLGGLDTHYSPAYFEDVDFCVRLWRLGWRVVYLPDVVVRHYENASSANPAEPQLLYERNHRLFVAKHADWLAWKCSSATTSPLWARSSHHDHFNVLLLLAGDLGPGMSPVRTEFVRLIERLRARNCFVTVYLIGSKHAPAGRQEDQFPADVEVLTGGSHASLLRFVVERAGYYESILAEDPNLLEQVRRFAVSSPARPGDLPTRAAFPSHEAQVAA
jgi:GT2 family glycosyltransferase